MKKKLRDWLQTRTYYREARELYEYIEELEHRNKNLEWVARMQSQLINSEYAEQKDELRDMRE